MGTRSKTHPPSATSLKEQVSEMAWETGPLALLVYKRQLVHLKKRIAWTSIKIQKDGLGQTYKRNEEKNCKHKTGLHPSHPAFEYSGSAPEQPEKYTEPGTDQGVTDLLSPVNWATSTSTTVSILKFRQKSPSLSLLYMGWSPPNSRWRRHSYHI